MFRSFSSLHWSGWAWMGKATPIQTAPQRANSRTSLFLVCVKYPLWVGCGGLFMCYLCPVCSKVVTFAPGPQVTQQPLVGASLSQWQGERWLLILHLEGAHHTVHISTAEASPMTTAVSLSLCVSQRKYTCEFTARCQPQTVWPSQEFSIKNLFHHTFQLSDKPYMKKNRKKNVTHSLNKYLLALT